MENQIKSHFNKLASLEDEAWEDFRKVITLRELNKGDLFLRENEVCRRLGFIVQGYMRVYFLSGDEEITKDFNFENSFCGSYASFSLQVPSRFNVIAMEKTKLYSIGRDDMFSLYEKHPSFQKVGRISMEKMFIRKELREASFLLDDAQQRYEELLQLYPGIANRVPLKHLASYLGIRPETLSRIRAK